jgi:hypothetical protein
MVRKHTQASLSGAHSISAVRAGRLFRLISLLAAGERSRAVLLRGLHLDLRGFYRDLEQLREFGVAISVRGHHYFLKSSLDKAIARLPFPDPKLNLHEAMILSKGGAAVHRKLQAQIRQITGRIRRK